MSTAHSNVIPMFIPSMRDNDGRLLTLPEVREFAEGLVEYVGTRLGFDAAQKEQARREIVRVLAKP